MHRPSRVMTPEVGFSHQRSPSFESMSSGHSSGSEFGIRQRTTVKPLELAKDNDISTLIRNQKETPIEKEIRLAKEREEELKKEKRNSHNLIIMNASKGAGETELQQNCITSQPAKRVQKEMGADIEMEKESKIPPTKDVSVQTKNYIVTNLQGLLEKWFRKRYRGHNSPNKYKALPSPLSEIEVRTKEYVPQLKQIKDVKTFLESCQKEFKKKNNLVYRTIPSNGKEGRIGASWASITRPIVNYSDDSTETSKPPLSTTKMPQWKGLHPTTFLRYRKERARHFGRSQPNLQEIDIEDEEDEEVRLPTMGKLRTALSNPNLLDSKPTVQKVVPNKRRSALIDEWENRIRNEQ
ncbi:hypothetical protein AAG570_013139 [Ranatra chinensis]|uniref:Uncharacterized protein n=1 Tax=Ranatra chinensis TaxID=642074 RepID=A0ABD0YFW0_9HEMI